MRTAWTGESTGKTERMASGHLIANASQPKQDAALLQAILNTSWI
jgi:hypothetical protein